MLVYLLKSTACMAIFLLFYKLLLEKEQMHIFKRFYLLTSILASFLIPTVVFVEYVEPIVSGYAPTQVINGPSLASTQPQARDIDVINWVLLGWTLYAIGLLGFGFRFCKNLFQILFRIKNNPKLKEKLSIKVLLRDQLPPHTFFKYIFLNKAAFEANTIPQEVLLHEEIHARQRHSIDVVFIELLQVILWFNPMIFFFKKSIKLNHEFLADSAVLKSTRSTSNYQNTLLSYLSKGSAQKYQSITMANAINYSSIKKRFKIMKTETSKQSKSIRSLLLLPLLAFMVYGFSSKKEVVKASENNTTEISEHTARSLDIIILEDGTYFLEGLIANKNNLSEVVNKLHGDISPEVRNKIMNIHLKSSTKISREEVWFVYNSLLDYGFYRLVTAEQEIIKGKGNKPLAVENEYDKDEQASPIQIKEYNTLARKYSRAQDHIIKKDIDRMKDLYNLMSDKQKEKATSFIDKIPQEGASRKLMAEYNALAKKYNQMDRNNMHILKSDVQRLEYIYGLMSDKQKADAEPFPDFPEPPPAPRAEEIIEVAPPKSPRVLKGEVSTIPPPLPASAKPTKAVKGDVMEVPPLPPEPIDPIDHVIEMAKNGATFYLEGKEISSDKAIELLKKNKKWNIQTTRSNSKNPWVKISKKPIQL